MKTLVTSFLILSSLLTSCTNDDQIPVSNPIETPIENPTPELPPVPQNIIPDWLKGGWESKFVNQYDGLHRVIQFGDNYGGMDLSFTNPVGDMVIQDYGIYFTLDNSDTSWGTVSNYKSYHENNLNWVTFDYVPAFHPDRVMKFEIHKSISNNELTVLLHQDGDNLNFGIWVPIL